MEFLSLADPGIAISYRVTRLSLEWPIGGTPIEQQQARIDITVRDSTGQITKHSYVGTEAQTLMTSLNKIDLSVTSLHKRVLNKLVTDGKLPAGSVTGSPD